MTHVQYQRRGKNFPYMYENPMCTQTDPDVWFPDENTPKAEIKLAIELCQSCDHEIECAVYAIIDPTITGIWGATTTQDRIKIRKKLKINESSTEYDSNYINDN